MLNQIRANRLTREQRLTAVQRALFSRPRFILLESTFEAGGILPKKRTQIKADYDTYITSALFNSTAYLGMTGTDRIFVEIYSLYRNSLYRSNENRQTLSSFVTFDARFLTSALPSLFDDRQREFMPFLVEANDSLIVETTISIAPLADVITRAVLTGFMVTPDSFYPAETLEQLNRSIARPVRSEHFDITVDHGLGRKIYRIQNDGFPRLLFGFGASGEEDTIVPIVNMQSTVLITDLTRRLQFSEVPIPVENFAPRIPMSEDQYVYYLPTEYYLEPFANLQFEILNSGADLPYTLTAHTRTV